MFSNQLLAHSRMAPSPSYNFAFRRHNSRRNLAASPSKNTKSSVFPKKNLVILHSNWRDLSYQTCFRHAHPLVRCFLCVERREQGEREAAKQLGQGHHEEVDDPLPSGSGRSGRRSKVILRGPGSSITRRLFSLTLFRFHITRQYFFNDQERKH